MDTGHFHQLPNSETMEMHVNKDLRDIQRKLRILRHADETEQLRRLASILQLAAAASAVGVKPIRSATGFRGGETVIIKSTDEV